MKKQITLLFLALITFSSCASLSSFPPQPEAPISIVIPPEPDYPVPTPFRPFYFQNKLETIHEESNVQGRLGTYALSVDRIRNIKDPNMIQYIDDWIDQTIAMWLDQGLPKYPGILRNQYVTINRPVKLEIAVYDAKNNIARFEIRRHIIISHNVYASDFEVHYLNLKTGQFITIDNLMNSKHGITELNQQVLASTNVFENPDDPQYPYYNSIPFFPAFSGLPANFSFLLDYPNHGITFLLNPADCSNCLYHDYNGMYPPYFSLWNFQTSLFDRYYSEDIDDNATDGDLQLNQAEYQHDSKTHTSVLDAKRNLSIIEHIPANTPSYLLDAAKDIKAELLDQILQYEKAHSVSLKTQTHEISLSIILGNLANSIQLHYGIGYDPRFYGSLIRNYHPKTNALLDLKDLFQKEYDVAALIDRRVSLLVASSLKEETLAMIDSHNFQITRDAFIIYINKKPESISANHFDSFNLPLNYFGIEQLDLSDWSE